MKAVKISLICIVSLFVLIIGYFLIVPAPQGMGTQLATDSTEYNLKDFTNRGEPDSEEPITPGENENVTNIYAYNYFNTSKGFEDYYLYRDSVAVCNVIFVNFKDYVAFNENTYNNYYNVFSNVNSTLATLSRNNFQFEFQFFVYNSQDSIKKYINFPMNYWFESTLYENAYNSSITLNPETNTNKQCNMKMLMLSSPNDDYREDIFWAHCYMLPNNSVDLLTINSSTPTNSITHELLHSLGIYDLYTYSSANYQPTYSNTSNVIAPVGTTDIMAYPYTTVYTSAENRLLLGWLGNNISTFGDADNTAIEIIDNQTETKKEYLLYDAMSLSGTIAYEFGLDENRKEFFLIECRKVNNQPYLIVQRINYNYAGNAESSNENSCFIYTFRNDRSNMYSFGQDVIGGDSSPLVYSDGTRLDVSITNILVKNNQIQFEFFKTKTPTVDKTTTDLKNPETQNFYIKTVDPDGNFNEVQAVWLFNTTDKTWHRTQNISIVYVNNQKYYAILEVEKCYSKARFVYDAWGSTTYTETPLTAKYQTLTLNKTVIQSTGDFINDIKSNITDFFGNLFG